MRYQDVIISPVITESSMRNAKVGKVTFKVNKDSTKQDIKKAIEKIFGVHAVSVATIKVAGKESRVGTRRFKSFTPSWKKAIVKLKEGEKIGIFESS